MPKAKAAKDTCKFSFFSFSGQQKTDRTFRESTMEHIGYPGYGFFQHHIPLHVSTHHLLDLGMLFSFSWVKWC